MYKTILSICICFCSLLFVSCELISDSKKTSNKVITSNKDSIESILKETDGSRVIAGVYLRMSEKDYEVAIDSLKKAVDNSISIDGVWFSFGTPVFKDSLLMSFSLFTTYTVEDANRIFVTIPANHPKNRVLRYFENKYGNDDGLHMDSNHRELLDDWNRRVWSFSYKTIELDEKVNETLDEREEDDDYGYSEDRTLCITISDTELLTAVRRLNDSIEAVQEAEALRIFREQDSIKSQFSGQL